jgi:hypothetical protein
VGRGSQDGNRLKEQMEYYIGFDLSHSSVADTAKWQQPNALRRATENPSFRYYEVTVSRKGHVTTQNTDRVILARGVEIAKSSAGCVSALECGTRHVRLFRRAGGMYFVYLGELRPCAIRARGVDVLELGAKMGESEVCAGGGGRCEAA